MKKKLFTLMTLLLCLCSGAWATDKVYSPTPASARLVQDDVLITGTYATKKVANSSTNVACFNITSSTAPVSIISKAANIKSITITGNRDTGSSDATIKAFNVLTSTNLQTFSTPTSGFTATKDNNGTVTSVTSLSDIPMIGNNQSYATSVTVSFTNPVMGIELTPSNNSSFSSISVTYDDAITVDEQLCEAHASSTSAYTGTNCTVTADGVQSGVTISSTYYYNKLSGDSKYIKLDLGTGKTFKTGDEIWVECNGNGIKQEGVKLNSSASATGAVTVVSVPKIGASMPMWVRYVTTDSSPWKDQQSLYVLRNSSDSRIYQVSVHRLVKSESTLTFSSTSGSADISEGTSFELPAFSSKTPSDMTITYSSSNEDVATVNETTGAVTLVATGTTTITASFAGNSAYNPTEATYTLNVINSTHSQFGYTEAVNGSNLDARSLSTGTLSHIALAQQFGSNISNYAGTSLPAYLDGTAYSSTDSWYYINYENEMSDSYVGYNITIDDGYALDLSKIDARVMVGTANDNYSWYVELLDKDNNVLYTSDNKVTTTADETTPLIADYISAVTLTGTVKIRLYILGNWGTWKSFSINKLQLTGNVVADSRPQHTITFAAGDGTGSVPAAITTREPSIILPAAPLLYKNGSTLTKWNDGDADHTVGTSYNISDDVTLTAQFEENASNVWTTPVNVTWTFKTSEGAPTIQVEGNSAIYSKRAIIGETPYDALMTIDATSGKFNNAGNTGYAQVNDGTKFTIPAVYNMVVTIKYNQTPDAVTNATFAGNNADSFDATAKTLAYTYKGAAETIDIIQVVEGKYPEYISVSYPVKVTQYATPTITNGNKFLFEGKGYKVTIAKADAEGTLMVSEDGGETYAEQTSPYIVWQKSGTVTYKAKVTGALTDSEIASEEVTVAAADTYDPTKKYVAWVYTDNYKSSANGDYQYYHVTGSNANDPMFTALQSDYNMVPVSYGSNDTPSNDLNNANLIILSEAVAGSSTLTNGMKSFVGNVPMINFKFFAYTKASTNNRWGWGAPENPKEANATIKPNSLKYKVLKNITSNSDGSVTFYSDNSGNQIQGVTWNENPDNFPATNTDLATLNTIWGKSGTEESSKTVMHTSSKFFAIGLSCDSRQYYNQNAFTIVKNAAEMLMAGENLTAEETSASSTVQSYGWATYIPAYNVQFAEGDAYVVTEINTSTGATKVESVTEVPANTPVLLKGAGEKTITILNSVPAAPSTNLMTICNGANGNKVPYVLAKNGTSAGFKKWTGSINTINGRAVMWLDSAIATAREFFSLDDVTTGINAIDNELLTIDNNAPMYNLAGQKVSKSYKGIVIVNGKKVLKK